MVESRSGAGTVTVASPGGSVVPVRPLNRPASSELTAEPMATGRAEPTSASVLTGSVPKIAALPNWPTCWCTTVPKDGPLAAARAVVMDTLAARGRSTGAGPTAGVGPRRTCAPKAWMAPVRPSMRSGTMVATARPGWSLNPISTPSLWRTAPVACTWRAMSAIDTRCVATADNCAKRMKWVSVSRPCSRTPFSVGRQVRLSPSRCAYQACAARLAFCMAPSSSARICPGRPSTDRSTIAAGSAGTARPSKVLLPRMPSGTKRFGSIASGLLLALASSLTMAPTCTATLATLSTPKPSARRTAAFSAGRCALVRRRKAGSAIAFGTLVLRMRDSTVSSAARRMRDAAGPATARKRSSGSAFMRSCSTRPTSFAIAARASARSVRSTSPTWPQQASMKTS